MNTQQQLDHMKSARQDLERALLLKPDDKDLLEQLLAIIARQQELEQALAGPAAIATRNQMPPGAPHA
jgi:hypothetical protein